MTPLESAILDHAAREHPRESCGLIVAGQYHPCRNVATDPVHSFTLCPEDWHPEASAIVHSHPDGEPYLSTADRIAQHRSGLDWLLVADGKIRKYPYAPLLLGRAFAYGASDCCTLICDAYRLAGITLQDTPRGDIDSDAKNNLIIRQLKLSGMRRFNNGCRTPGDIVLTKHGGYPCHAAVLIDRNRIVHHPKDQTSRVEAFDGYWARQHHSTWRHPSWRCLFYTAILNDLAAATLST